MSKKITTMVQDVAPTVAELGKKLPNTLKEKDRINDLCIWKTKSGWQVDYGYHASWDKTLANTFAKMWL